MSSRPFLRRRSPRVRFNFCLHWLMLMLPLSSSVGLAQGQTALPYLLISPAPDANGMGNSFTTVSSDNAITMTACPGQLGMFSLRSNFSASSYANKTDWLPVFNADITYNAWGLAAGIDLSKVLPLPFPIGIGFGYSSIDLDLGTFIITGPGGPEEIGTFGCSWTPWEHRIHSGIGSAGVHDRFWPYASGSHRQSS